MVGHFWSIKSNIFVNISCLTGIQDVLLDVVLPKPQPACAVGVILLSAVVLPEPQPACAVGIVQLSAVVFPKPQPACAVGVILLSAVR